MLLVALAAIDGLFGGTSTRGHTTPSVKPVGFHGSWKLEFDTEFSGHSLDTRIWQPNNDDANQNNVTAFASNATVSNGHLILRLASSSSGAEIFTPRFGLAVGQYAEARIDFAGSGATVYNWPAWWVTGPDWPSAGESDIAEGLGALTVNYHSPSGAHLYGPIRGDWTERFHTYGIYRTQRYCDVYWDGKLVKRYRTDDDGKPDTLVLTLGAANHIVTGRAGEMIVDYVRVWQHG